MSASDKEPSIATTVFMSGSRSGKLGTRSAEVERQLKAAQEDLNQSQEDYDTTHKGHGR